MSESIIDKVTYKWAEVKRFSNTFLNSIAYKKAERWAIAGGMTLLFLLRIILSHKFVAIAYFVYIYLLSSFLEFIAPKAEADIGDLPISGSDTGEFKSYQRKLPEFEFWERYVTAHLVGFALTMFRFLNIPVYAPLLIVYCCVLSFFFVRQEFEKWRRHSVDAKTVMKYWIGMDKPNYK